MTALATERLLQVAGLLVWAMVGVTAAADVAVRGVTWDPTFVGWTACYLAWGAAFARVTHPGGSDPPAVCLALLGVQSATAIALTHWGYGAAEPALLAAVAGQTSFLLVGRARARETRLAQPSILALPLFRGSDSLMNYGPRRPTDGHSCFRAVRP